MQSKFPCLQLTAAPMPCALDLSVVSPDSLLLSMKAGDVSFLGSENASLVHYSGGRSLWRQVSNDVGQHVSTSVVECYSLSLGAP